MNNAAMDDAERIRRIDASSRSLARAVVFPLLVLIVSFVPILFLTGQERKLFGPLALTKTFVLIGAILVSLTVVPALMACLVKGKLRSEQRNPLTRFFTRLYRPVLAFAFRFKKTTVAFALGLILIGIPMVLSLGREFMPPLDEGSILLMPTLLPDVSNAEAKRILQVQDRLLADFPEVANVLGKAGRASTATDNAPISMVETIILLKPRSQWRKGVDKDSLVREMEKRVRIPGVVNGWTQPIINRINMLSTGIRTDVGVKVFGPSLDTIYAIALKIEAAVRGIQGLQDLYAERITDGRFLDVTVKRGELGRYGLTVADVNMVVEAAIGGMALSQTVEGRRRFDISVRLAEDFRAGPEQLRRIPIATSRGPVPLERVADITLAEGPAMINSENAMLRGTVLFNARGRDMGSVAAEAREKVDAIAKDFPSGYFLTWSGQYENQLRAEKRLRIILPFVLAIIVLIIYWSLKSWKEVGIVVASLPLSLVGGAYSMFFFGANFSVGVAVGFIALFGIAVETGVLMIVYLNNALAVRMADREAKGTPLNAAGLDAALQEGASMGLRPILMTNLANLIGILPILLSTGVGSDVMRPIVLPFEFGLITSTLFAFIVLPVLYGFIKHGELRRYGRPRVLAIEA
ncbi:MAG: efflux RND transporter permease subunit [Fibrobacteria bacterium]